MITVSPTRADIQSALRAFLLDILPSGIEVVEGMDNLVPEPQGSDFVVMWGLNRNRLATNVDTDSDVFFTGSIDNTTLTVTGVAYGTILPNTNLFGPNVTTGTTILSYGSGTGGVGTYTINNTQTVATQNFAAGYETKEQDTEVIYQLDVHGPNSPDNAQIISTMFRDEYGVDFLEGQNENVAPLYTSDPRFVPFIGDGEQQTEERWIIEARLQVNTTIIVPQDFATAVAVNVISVEEAYQEEQS
jgi:hypothetical protein